MMKKTRSGLSDVKVVGRSKRYAAPGTRYILFITHHTKCSRQLHHHPSWNHCKLSSIYHGWI